MLQYDCMVLKWSHDYKRDVLHPNKTQTRTCTASMTTSDVSNQWRSIFQQQINLTTKNSTILNFGVI